MSKRPVTLHAYRALFELSALRDLLRGLHDELAEEDAARLTSRLQRLERDALQLLALVEDRRPIASH